MKRCAVHVRQRWSGNAPGPTNRLREKATLYGLRRGLSALESRATRRRCRWIIYRLGLNPMDYVQAGTKTGPDPPPPRQMARLQGDEQAGPLLSRELSTVQARARESVTLSVGTPLCTSVGPMDYIRLGLKSVLPPDRWLGCKGTSRQARVFRGSSRPSRRGSAPCAAPPPSRHNPLIFFTTPKTRVE